MACGEVRCELIIKWQKFGTDQLAHLIGNFAFMMHRNREFWGVSLCKLTVQT